MNVPWNWCLTYQNISIPNFHTYVISFFFVGMFRSAPSLCLPFLKKVSFSASSTLACMQRAVGNYIWIVVWDLNSCAHVMLIESSSIFGNLTFGCSFKWMTVRYFISSLYQFTFLVRETMRDMSKLRIFLNLTAKTFNEFRHLHR